MSLLIPINCSRVPLESLDESDQRAFIALFENSVSSQGQVIEEIQRIETRCTVIVQGLMSQLEVLSQANQDMQEQVILSHGRFRELEVAKAALVPVVQERDHLRAMIEETKQAMEIAEKAFEEQKALLTAQRVDAVRDITLVQEERFQSIQRHKEASEQNANQRIESLQRDNALAIHDKEVETRVKIAAIQQDIDAYQREAERQLAAAQERIRKSS